MSKNQTVKLNKKPLRKIKLDQLDDDPMRRERYDQYIDQQIHPNQTAKSKLIYIAVNNNQLENQMKASADVNNVIATRKNTMISPGARQQHQKNIVNLQNKIKNLQMNEDNFNIPAQNSRYQHNKTQNEGMLPPTKNKKSRQFKLNESQLLDYNEFDNDIKQHRGNNQSQMVYDGDINLNNEPNILENNYLPEQITGQQRLGKQQLFNSNHHQSPLQPIPNQSQGIKMPAVRQSPMYVGPEPKPGQRFFSQRESNRSQMSNQNEPISKRKSSLFQNEANFKIPQNRDSLISMKNNIADPRRSQQYKRNYGDSSLNYPSINNSIQQQILNENNLGSPVELQQLEEKIVRLPNSLIQTQQSNGVSNQLKNIHKQQQTQSNQYALPITPNINDRNLQNSIRVTQIEENLLREDQIVLSPSYKIGNKSQLNNILKNNRSQNTSHRGIASTNASRNTMYDQNGRRNRSRMNLTSQMTANHQQQQLIENQYNELQKSYNEIFKSQEDYKYQNRNQQLLSQFENLNHEMSIYNQRGLQNLSMIEQPIRSPSNQLFVTTPNNFENGHFQKGNFRNQSTRESPQGAKQGQILQQQSGLNNNNNYQNNISYSIIMVQPGAEQLIKGGLDNHQSQNPNQQPNYQDSQRYSEQQHLINNSNLQQQYDPAAQEIFSLSNDPMSGLSDDQFDDVDAHQDISRNQIIAAKTQKLPNPKLLHQTNRSQNFTQIQSSEKLSSNDPESLERQNIQMLEQILKNNKLKSKYRKQKSQKQRGNLRKKSNDVVSDERRKNNSSSQGSKRNNLMLRFKQDNRSNMKMQNQSKSQSSPRQFSPTDSQNSRIINFSTFIKNQLKQSDQKGNSIINRSSQEEGSQEPQKESPKDGYRPNEIPYEGRMDPRHGDIRQRMNLTQTDIKQNFNLLNQFDINQLNRDIQLYDSLNYNQTFDLKHRKRQSQQNNNIRKTSTGFSSQTINQKRKSMKMTELKSDKVLAEQQNLHGKEENKAENNKGKSKTQTKNKPKEISSKAQASKKKLSAEKLEKPAPAVISLDTKELKQMKNSKNLQIKDIKDTQAKIQEQYKDTQNKIHVLLKENFAFKDVDHSQITDQMMKLLSNQLASMRSPNSIFNTPKNINDKNIKRIQKSSSLNSKQFFTKNLKLSDGNSLSRHQSKGMSSQASNQKLIKNYEKVYQENRVIKKNESLKSVEKQRQNIMNFEAKRHQIQSANKFMAQQRQEMNMSQAYEQNMRQRPSINSAKYRGRQNSLSLLQVQNAPEGQNNEEDESTIKHIKSPSAQNKQNDTDDQVEVLVFEKEQFVGEQFIAEFVAEKNDCQEPNVQDEQKNDQQNYGGNVDNLRNQGGLKQNQNEKATEQGNNSGENNSEYTLKTAQFANMEKDNGSVQHMKVHDQQIRQDSLQDSQKIETIPETKDSPEGEKLDQSSRQIVVIDEQQQQEPERSSSRQDLLQQTDEAKQDEEEDQEDQQMEDLEQQMEDQDQDSVLSSKMQEQNEDFVEVDVADEMVGDVDEAEELDVVDAEETEGKEVVEEEDVQPLEVPPSNTAQLADDEGFKAEIEEHQEMKQSELIKIQGTNQDESSPTALESERSHMAEAKEASKMRKSQSLPDTSVDPFQEFLDQQIDLVINEKKHCGNIKFQDTATTLGTDQEFENESLQDEQSRPEKENDEENLSQNMIDNKHNKDIQKFKAQDTKFMMHMYDRRYSAEHRNPLEINLANTQPFKYSNSKQVKDTKTGKNLDLTASQISEKMESLDHSSIESQDPRPSGSIDYVSIVPIKDDDQGCPNFIVRNQIKLFQRSRELQQWLGTIYQRTFQIKNTEATFYKNEDVYQDVQNLLQFLELTNRNMPAIQQISANFLMGNKQLCNSPNPLDQGQSPMFTKAYTFDEEKQSTPKGDISNNENPPTPKLSRQQLLQELIETNQKLLCLKIDQKCLQQRILTENTLQNGQTNPKKGSTRKSFTNTNLLIVEHNDENNTKIRKGTTTRESKNVSVDMSLQGNRQGQAMEGHASNKSQLSVQKGNTSFSQALGRQPEMAKSVHNEVNDSSHKSISDNEMKYEGFNSKESQLSPKITEYSQHNMSINIYDSVRSQASSLFQKYAYAIISPAELRQFEKDVVLKYKLKKFLNKKITGHLWQNLGKQMRRQQTLQVGTVSIKRPETPIKSLDFGALLGHPPKSMEDLLEEYYKEQFAIQVKVDKLREKELMGLYGTFQMSKIRDYDSDDGSKILDSTISDRSHFSCLSAYGDYENAMSDELLSPLNFKNLDHCGKFDCQDYPTIKGEASIGGAYSDGNNSASDQDLTKDHITIRQINTERYQETGQNLGLKLGPQDTQQAQYKKAIQMEMEFRQPKFFNNVLQKVNDHYERMKLQNVNQILEAFDLKTIGDRNFSKSYYNGQQRLKQIRNIGSGRQLRISQSELTRLVLFFQILYANIKKKKILSYNVMELMKRFQIENYLEKSVFIYIDKEEWIMNRLSFIRQETVRSVIKQQLNRSMENKWLDNQKLLKKFFGQNNIKEDEDVDFISLSDDCESELYNNLHAISSIHQNKNPIPLYDIVIQEKNMQYEIFKILSQSKLKKLKNKIIQDKNDLYDFRIKFIDCRMKQIKDSVKSKDPLEQARIAFLEQQSDNSSDFGSSDDSIQQTAKYLYIEDLEQQKLVKRQMRCEIAMEEAEAELPQVEHRGTDHQNVITHHSSFKQESLRSATSRSHRSNSFQHQGDRHHHDEMVKSHGGPTSDHHDKRSRKNHHESDKATTGFRYGVRNRKSHSQNAIWELKKMIAKKDPAKVRLTNGILLSLGEEKNVDFNLAGLNVPQLKKAEKDTIQVQGYYDDIKKILRSKSSGNQIIIDYKRQPLLFEHEIDGSGVIQLKKFLNNKISQFMKLRKSTQAVFINLRHPTQRYVNPFELTSFVKEKNMKELMARREAQMSLEEGKDEKDQKNKERPPKLPKPSQSPGKIRINKKFSLGDSQFSSNELQSKEKTQNYKRGGKCKHYKFICKFQSLGDNNQLRELEQTGQIYDKSTYNDHYCDMSRLRQYPIYSMFEVFHVKRKSAFEQKEEQIVMSQKLKSITEEEIRGQVPNPNENFLQSLMR